VNYQGKKTKTYSINDMAQLISDKFHTLNYDDIVYIMNSFIRYTKRELANNRVVKVDRVGVFGHYIRKPTRVKTIKGVYRWQPKDMIQPHFKTIIRFRRYINRATYGKQYYVKPEKIHDKLNVKTYWDNEYQLYMCKSLDPLQDILGYGKIRSEAIKLHFELVEEFILTVGNTPR